MTDEQHDSNGGKMQSAISAVRSDGRLFRGWVESMKKTPRGTLVIVAIPGSERDGYGQVERIFRSIYLEECRRYTMLDTLEE
jgi:hypothetical protein